jgi:uncharacterized LabA/DUF88 family protein
LNSRPYRATSYHGFATKAHTRQLHGGTEGRKRRSVRSTLGTVTIVGILVAYMGADRRSWMMFVDGENFTLRAERFASDNGIQLIDGGNYLKETLIWLPNRRPTAVMEGPIISYLASNGIRAYYYTSMKSDEDKINEARQRLWKLGFTPNVFKKIRKEDKAKGVDIALTKDMLVHASQNHYEVACLVAGDGDYVPLVEEVKRMGKIVVCMFFGDNKSGLSDALKIASDEFYDISKIFTESWKFGATP